MSKPKLKLTPIPRTREEWLAKRIEGIGGSEVAAILGLNPYACALEVFYKKVGLLPEDGQDNFKMFMGRLLEPQIAELWKHWDGSQDSVIENYEAGTPIRNCVEVHSKVQNNEFPYLYAHIDRLICKNEQDMLNPNNGILEIKNINYYAIKQWEEGIPAYHIVQVQTYLAITGLKYAEIVCLVDGNKLQIHEIVRDESMIADIIYKTGEFWKRVEIGRAIMENPNMSEDEKYAAIQQFEPKPDTSKAWEDFYKDFFKADPELPVLEGTDELLNLAKEYQEVSNAIKDLEDFKQGYKNSILALMGNHTQAVFEGNGKITWKEDKRGTRTLRIGLKHFEFAS